MGLREPMEKGPVLSIEALIVALVDKQTALRTRIESLTAEQTRITRRIMKVTCASRGVRSESIRRRSSSRTS